MKDLPSIILISPPSKKVGEQELLIKFFDAGLKRFHLRKPKFSVEELNNYLKKIPEKYLSRIVVHRKPELTEQFSLGGYHYRSDELTLPLQGTRSRSLHSIKELKNLKDSMDYAFLGPVYESISKEGYKPKVSLSELFLFFNSVQIKTQKKQTKVFALGGIRKKKLRKLAQVGFDGVALLGSVWGSRDPLAAMNDFLNLDLEFSLSSRSNSL